MNTLLQQPFVQVALPILIGFFLVHVAQNKRIDDLRSDINRRLDTLTSEMTRRLDEIVKRLDRIEQKLDDHEKRIVRLEERTSPVRG